MRKLPKRNFFEKSTLIVAKQLLGMELSTRIRGKKTSGIIVEVEAYRHKIDQASHTYRGKTKRNEVMFKHGGHCYVYFIYGKYFCVNVVTEKEGIGSAVLIRAIEPLNGIQTMKRRRRMNQAASKKLPEKLTNGPGKLCQALGIDGRLSGEDLLNSSAIYLRPALRLKSKQIGRSTRIGITKSTELKWRFFIKNNSWVSKN